MREAVSPAGACGERASRRRGKPMGGARPAGGSDFVYRCCLVLCTAAITVLGATVPDVQGSGAQALPAATPAAPPRQSAHIKTVRPHKIVRHLRAARTARAGP